MKDIRAIKASGTKLCFSSGWRMRNDRERALLYKYSNEEAQWRVLPPLPALILTLFDGTANLKQVNERLAATLGCSREKARGLIEGILSTYYLSDDPVLVESSAFPDGDWRVYDTDSMYVPPQKYKPAKRLDAPLSLLLMPSASCKARCRYCYAEQTTAGKTAWLSLSRWKEIIDEASGAGIDIATFSGGDPMLYPGIMPLIGRLIDKDFSFTISTKAYVPASTARRLVDMGYGKRYFQVSIDAWDAGLADFMVRQKGYRDSALRSIQNILGCGLNIRTNTVCTPYNFRDIPALLRNLVELGVKRSSVAIYGRSMYAHDDAYLMPESGLAWLKEQVDKIRNDYPGSNISLNGSIIDYNKVPPREKKKRWKARAHCSGGSSSMTICADGRVTLCEQIPQKAEYTAGNLKRQSLLEVWNSRRMLEVAFPPREKFANTVCFDCDEFDDCHYEHGYCFRDSLNVYGTVYAPPPNCPKASPSLRLA